MVPSATINARVNAIRSLATSVCSRLLSFFGREWVTLYCSERGVLFEKSVRHDLNDAANPKMAGIAQFSWANTALVELAREQYNANHLGIEKEIPCRRSR